MNYFFTAPQLVHEGDINYLVSDYLSEITMSLLTAAKRKSPVSIEHVHWKLYIVRFWGKFMIKWIPYCLILSFLKCLVTLIWITSVRVRVRDKENRESNFVEVWNINFFNPCSSFRLTLLAYLGRLDLTGLSYQSKRLTYSTLCPFERLPWYNIYNILYFSLFISSFKGVGSQIIFSVFIILEFRICSWLYTCGNETSH